MSGRDGAPGDAARPEIAPAKVPTWGYEPATAPPGERAPYLACVSWPRSGHHLLVNLLRLVLGDRFGYCESYVPATRPDVPCCQSFPCLKRDVITMSKNHDFELASPVPTDVRLIVQHRAFLPTLVSNYELHVKNGNLDSAESWRAFATRTLKGFKGFRAKWVVPAMANRLTLDYETLTGDPLGSLRRVLDFMGLPDEPQDALARAVAEAPAREGGQGEPGVRVTRDVTGFRWYDAAFFAELGAIAADDTAVPLPVIEAPAGPRRNMSPKRPLFVYVHLPRAAGVAIRVALTELLGRQSVFWHGRDGDVEEIVRRGDADSFKAFDVVGGMVPAHLFPATVAGRPTILTAIVRNPIGRALSLYRAAGAGPRLIHALGPDAEFAASVRAAQCVALAGVEDGDEAVMRLFARPHLLATHEHAQDLVDRIGAIVGMAGTVKVRQQNMNAPGYQTPLRTPDALARLRKVVADDMTLFQRLGVEGGMSERLPGRKR